MPNFLRIMACWTIVVLSTIVAVVVLAFVNSFPVIQHYEIDWAEFATLIVIGFCLLASALEGMCEPARAAFLPLYASPLVAILTMFAAPGSARGERAALVVFQVSLVVAPGIFWICARRAKWQPLLRQGTRTLLLRTVFVFAVIGAATTLSLCLPVSSAIDCKLKEPFFSRQYAGQAVFTARIVRLGWPHYQYFPIRVVAPWAIARVEREFWGVPSVGGLVILHMPLAADYAGERVFVDSPRSKGVFTRFLPVIDWDPCSAIRRLETAEPYIRAIEKGPPKSGGRITGTVLAKSGRTVSGATVVVEGPDGPRKLRTDARGVYELEDARPGDYEVHLPSEQPRGEYPWTTAVRKSDVFVRDFYLR